MSKITPKNLSYDTTLPPFLARLQAANQGNDRHEFSVARPKKQRTAEEEAEDEPVYFNEESGEMLTKGEWEKREEEESKFGGEGAGAGKDGAVDGERKEGEDGKEGEGREKEKEKIAAIGGTRKRKAGKVVGGEEGEADSTKKPEIKEVKGDTTARTTTSKPEIKKGDKPKAAKKAKKIKLSFDD